MYVCMCIYKHKAIYENVNKLSPADLQAVFLSYCTLPYCVNSRLSMLFYFCNHKSGLGDNFIIVVPTLGGDTENEEMS